MALYDFLVVDRNRGLRDPERRIPRCRVMSREECLSEFPGLQPRGLTGAALFSDGQMYSPPRLVLSFLRSAAERGASLANYLEVTEFGRLGDRVCEVRARDRLTGDALAIRGKVVINAAGPWAERLLLGVLGSRLEPPGVYSRDACFVVGKPWASRYALAVQGETRDPDALVSRRARHLFLVPWRDHTLVGVWHEVHEGHPDQINVTERELAEFVREINLAYPPISLTLQDVTQYNAGLVLFGENRPGAHDLSYGKRSRIVDHGKAHGVDGLITVIGVRSTTARGVAEKAVHLACQKLGRKPRRSESERTPIYGGSIESFRDFRQSALAARPEAIPAEVIDSLVQNHGSAYANLLKYGRAHPDLLDTVGASKVLRAEVVHAVREEMAVKLSDVVFRRTDLGSAGDPGNDAIAICAQLMAAELGWARERLDAEVEEVAALFPSFSEPSTAARIT